LFHVVEAGSPLGEIPGFAQRGQQHGRKNCDDSYDNQQFYKCEILFHFFSFDI
jgi:hypothetical protein